MGFDLWSALGVSPTVGIAVAVGGVAVAAVMAFAIFRRNRAGGESAVFSLADDPPDRGRHTRPS